MNEETKKYILDKINEIFKELDGQKSFSVEEIKNANYGELGYMFENIGKRQGPLEVVRILRHDLC